MLGTVRKCTIDFLRPSAMICSLRSTYILFYSKELVYVVDHQKYVWVIQDSIRWFILIAVNAPWPGMNHALLTTWMNMLPVNGNCVPFGSSQDFGDPDQVNKIEKYPFNAQIIYRKKTWDMSKTTRTFWNVWLCDPSLCYNNFTCLSIKGFI